MPTPTQMLPQQQQQQIRLITYADVTKYLVGSQASKFIVFAMVIGHLMFASGLLHLCYVVGWERLGWSYYTQEEYVEGGDESNSNRRMLMLMMMNAKRHLGHSNDSGDDHSNDRASRSSDEEEYYYEWTGPDLIGRLAMSALLFPIIHGLLQIPSLTELATISTYGLVSYVIGCIGSMLYTAVILTNGHPFADRPDDMWETKWSGIPGSIDDILHRGY